MAGRASNILKEVFLQFIRFLILLLAVIGFWLYVIVYDYSVTNSHNYGSEKLFTHTVGGINNIKKDNSEATVTKLENSLPLKSTLTLLLGIEIVWHARKVGRRNLVPVRLYNILENNRGLSLRQLNSKLGLNKKDVDRKLAAYVSVGATVYHCCY